MRLCLALSLACSGCSQCSGDGAVAELTSVVGRVEADDAADPVAFTPAAVGRRFVIGEAIRTDAQASADLALAGGGTLHVDPDSVVRFARDASSLDRVDVEQGSSTIEAPSDAPIAVETVFGTAHLDARTRTRIGPRQGRFEVVVGHATVERAGASVVDLAVGTAVDQRGAAAPAFAAAAAAGAAAAVAASRTIDVRGTGGQVLVQGATEYAQLSEGRSQVAAGSTLRTDHGTTIEIATPDGHIRMQSDAEISLGAASARATHGRFEVEGAGRTRLEVPGGAIILSDEDGPTSASLDLSASGDAQVVVRSGSVVRETADGAVRIRPASADAASANAPSAPTDELAAVVLRAGETVAIHDPSPPVRTRIEATADCSSPTWRVDGRAQSASAGHAALVIALRAGSHRYELRCGSGPRQDGTIRVDRERGIASMSRTAPRTVVDADGRPYSVLYQTLLPEILLRWPRAPGAGPYTIDVQRGGNTRHVSTASASHTFASGEIAEGTSTLVFRAADGSRSPPTTLDIRFDNTTPVASLREPAAGTALSSPVHVAGTAAEGAHVSIGGTSVTLDRSERFAADAPLVDGCVAIRVALAGRGIHYYVRCGGAR